jgi:hypothetical protein
VRDRGRFFCGPVSGAGLSGPRAGSAPKQDPIRGIFNEPVQKLQFLNNNRLKTKKKLNFSGKFTFFRGACSITNRLIEQAQCASLLRKQISDNIS